MYSAGIAGSSSLVAEFIVTHPMKYWSCCIGWGVFMVQGRNRAFFAFGARRIIGSCDKLIHPCFQSIFGCTVANQEYPKIALCSPRSDRKKRNWFLLVPVWTLILV